MHVAFKENVIIFSSQICQLEQSSNIQSDTNYYTNCVANLFFGDFPVDHIKIVFWLTTFLVATQYINNKILMWCIKALIYHGITFLFFPSFQSVTHYV